MTPANLEKHVAKANPTPAAPAKQPTHSKGALEFADLPARYRRAPLSEAEMEAIEVTTHISFIEYRDINMNYFIIVWRCYSYHLSLLRINAAK